MHHFFFADFYSRNKWNKAVDSAPPMLKEPAGFWEMYCDTEETDNEGLTELDRMWAAAKELVAENIFIQASYKEPGRNGPIVAIKCFIPDYSDIEKVMQSAAKLRQFHFPGVFYMKTHYFDEFGQFQFMTRYLHCSDGDLYERTHGNMTGFRLLKSYSSVNS